MSTELKLMTIKVNHDVWNPQLGAWSLCRSGNRFLQLRQQRCLSSHQPVRTFWLGVGHWEYKIYLQWSSQLQTAICTLHLHTALEEDHVITRLCKYVTPVDSTFCGDTSFVYLVLLQEHRPIRDNTLSKVYAFDWLIGFYYRVMQLQMPSLHGLTIHH